MASDTGTRKADRVSAARRLTAGAVSRLRPLLISRLALVIITVNLVALAVLVFGMFAITENQRGLVQAKIDSLTAQGGLVRNVVVQVATEGDPAPSLDPALARDTLSSIFVPPEARALIHDKAGRLVADSRLQAGRVGVSQLPPAGDAAREAEQADPSDWVAGLWRRIALSETEREALDRTLLEEVRTAIDETRIVTGVRRGPDGQRVVSATLPVQRVQAVVGAITFESYDLDALVAAERRAIIPYVVFAALVSLLSAAGLTAYIAAPVRRLADAARAVRLAGGRRVPLPDMRGRRDEIGALGNAFAAMTEALYDRLDAIESFAADVAHEIKNPLTSIRSAAEVLPKAKDAERRDKLIGVIQHDVKRLDRLVTDISNASRLDAELARETLAPVDLGRLLREVSSVYAGREGAAAIEIEVEPKEPFVAAREGPLGRVFTNLLDNALTFSPPDGAVRVRVRRSHAGGRSVLIVTVDDEGPGVPADNLESIFDRFYTRRPDGAAFGAHSGLGLAIARQIVAAHGGHVFAENRTGEDGAVEGARFTVSLPAAGRGDAQR